MNNNFEANFSITGTPTIRIYKVVGETYTLVKTDTMIATPETGKYAYEYKDLRQFSDYSARMTLGDEEMNAVYNGLFSEIFAKAGTGGGGGGYKITKIELDRIVSEMIDLFKEGLSSVEIALPDGLGEKEVSEAVSKIKDAGIASVEKISKAAIKNEEVVGKFLLQIEKNKLDTPELSNKIDLIISKQSEISGAMKDDIIKQISENISGQEGRFKKFASLLAVFRKEQQKEAKDFARLLAAFRNELKK